MVSAPSITTTKPVSRRPVDASSPGLDWLAVGAGVGSLRDGNGNLVRLQGLRCPADAADVLPLLAEVSFGQRCIAESLALTAQLQPAALAQLDQRLAARARSGAFTLLRIGARLWLNGHHLKLAKRYRNEPAVMFALLGRSSLSGKLFAAAVAMRRFNGRAVIWLPLESASVAQASRLNLGNGWLWDAALPQRPPAGLLQGSLRQPVMLDGWQPQAHSPLAHDRLMSLCRQGGIGWLAQSATPWLNRRNGLVEWNAAARIVQRAVQLG